MAFDEYFMTFCTNLSGNYRENIMPVAKSLLNPG